MSVNPSAWQQKMNRKEKKRKTNQIYQIILLFVSSLLLGACGTANTDIANTSNLAEPELPPTETSIPVEVEEDDLVMENRFEDGEYGLALSYPSSWTLDLIELPSRDGEEEQSSKMLTFQQDYWVFTLHYKYNGDTTIINGGFGAGETIKSGAISILGTSVSINKLVYENKTKAVWYQANLSDVEIFAKLENAAHIDYELVEVSLPVTYNTRQQVQKGVEQSR